MMYRFFRGVSGKTIVLIFWARYPIHKFVVDLKNKYSHNKFDWFRVMFDLPRFFVKQKVKIENTMIRAVIIFEDDISNQSKYWSIFENGNGIIDVQWLNLFKILNNLLFLSGGKYLLLIIS